MPGFRGCKTHMMQRTGSAHISTYFVHAYLCTPYMHTNLLGCVCKPTLQEDVTSYERLSGCQRRDMQPVFVPSSHEKRNNPPIMVQAVLCCAMLCPRDHTHHLALTEVGFTLPFSTVYTTTTLYECIHGSIQGCRGLHCPRSRKCTYVRVQTDD